MNATKYGELTVDRHTELARQGVHLHVFYNGEDVTKRCMWADDTGDGLAELLLYNAEGRPYVRQATDEVATQIVSGIEIREGEPLS